MKKMNIWAKESLRESLLTFASFDSSSFIQLLSLFDPSPGSSFMQVEYDDDYEGRWCHVMSHMWVM